MSIGRIWGGFDDHVGHFAVLAVLMVNAVASFLPRFGMDGRRFARNLCPNGPQEGVGQAVREATQNATIHSPAQLWLRRKMRRRR